MTEIRIYGASDDLIEVEGCEGADEFNSYETRYMWRGDLIAPGGEAMRVHAIYDGCWSFAVGQPDESIPFPTWQVTIWQHTDTDYSVLVLIEAPDGTRLDNVWPGEDGAS